MAFEVPSSKVSPEKLDGRRHGAEELSTCKNPQDFGRGYANRIDALLEGGLW